MATAAVKKGSQDNVTVMLVMFDRCDVDRSLAGLGDLPGTDENRPIPFFLFGHRKQTYSIPDLQSEISGSLLSRANTALTTPTIMIEQRLC